MNYLSVEELSKSFGDRVLFDKISFGVEKGQKVALIAKNGAGKTTFLNCLTGKEPVSEGRIVWRNDITVGYLNQEQIFDSTHTINEEIFKADNTFMQAINFYNDAVNNGADADTFQQAMDRMDSLQAWDYEAKLKQILGSLQLHDLEQRVNTLSGGQKKRLALAKVLIEQPEFIILDEPTNHLDLEMIEWLENYLATENMTLLMVTHDRYFLERVCDSIIEIDNGQLYSYKGSYAYYIEKKQERESITMSEIEKAKNLYKKELEWMRRMPQARATKAKSRQDAFYEVEKSAKRRIKKEEVKLEVVGQRMGGKILEFHHLRKSFGDKKIVEDFNYTFKRGDRVGIVGPNGVGKSSFIKLITGELEADGGKIVQGETVVVGHYAQDGMHLDEDKRIIDVVKDIAEIIPLAKGRKITASQFLERFLFPPKQQYTYVSKLSGGEKRRLYLLTVLMDNPNFLILDEPTNDLDIMTLNVLEDFLMEFEGCVMVVTHDRFFMDKIVDHLFVFKGDGIIKDFNGKYTDYKEESKREAKEAAQLAKAEQVKKAAPVVEKTKEKKKLSFNEQREFDGLEKSMAELEKRKAEINELMLSGISDAEEITKLSKELAAINDDLEEQEMRWLELSELV
ncbi:ABC-F family ATP-binding cassette domain-containing protein [Acidiluteibacter ferrifornacis]|uniref:ATP-binding cassette domain-containing protein n=1 Tax=Acidiluteibacter ferrifornacis TaxID=2692424 RepID=A0A6N9NLN6_9FLAO|nr:ABC-F family ATP-binding cassette domain-containing protein [Acidiluteibacter ferrifornacis]NBG66782.1 ATP-binding cassette domain-containing protein [Acidiluteibacter ferrifornacis]